MIGEPSNKGVKKDGIWVQAKTPQQKCISDNDA